MVIGPVVGFICIWRSVCRLVVVCQLIKCMEAVAVGVVEYGISCLNIVVSLVQSY